MVEEWKQINGYGGKYSISNFGRVLSHNYRNTGKEGMLTPKIARNGRALYHLYGDEGQKEVLAHRLVAMHFLENPLNLPQVNHKDENPLNNRVDNLEWCDPSYNIRYSLNLHPERWERIRTMRRNSTRSSSYRTKWTKKKVEKCNEDGTPVELVECAKEYAKAHHYNLASIIKCCTGERAHAYGYKWRFAE